MTAPLTDRNRDVVRRVLEEGESMADVGRAMALSRQRIEQILRPEQRRARNRLHAAVRTGAMAPAIACQVCGSSDQVIEAHHPDYEQWDRVVWCCRPCHLVLDDARQAVAGVVKRPTGPRPAAAKAPPEARGNTPDDRLLTARAAAAYLGYAVATVYQKKSRGELPFVKLGYSVRFRQSDLDRWITEQDAAGRAAVEGR
jgi:excisionase family DNA binding protein